MCNRRKNGKVYSFLGYFCNFATESAWGQVPGIQEMIFAYEY